MLAEPSEQAEGSLTVYVISERVRPPQVVSRAAAWPSPTARPHSVSWLQDCPFLPFAAENSASISF